MLQSLNKHSLTVKNHVLNTLVILITYDKCMKNVLRSAYKHTAVFYTAALLHLLIYRSILQPLLFNVNMLPIAPAMEHDPMSCHNYADDTHIYITPGD